MPSASELRAPGLPEDLLISGDPLDLDDDPLVALANLFDVAIVFAVALVVALAAALRVPLADLNARPELRDARPVPLEPSDRVAGGKGTRMGVAYRLESGEMVYVPDENLPAAEKR